MLMLAISPPPEAMWRLLQFRLHEQKPSVQRLQVHLPGTFYQTIPPPAMSKQLIISTGQHRVLFDPREDPVVIRQRAATERTTLTEYFRANADPVMGPEAQKYTYQEFPQHFTWIDGQNRWKIRQSHFTIGRMYFVGPTAGERFYLRTLLTVVKGATSFEHLRTYEGQLCPTFRDACIKRGLLEDDGEWRMCLQEACEMQTGSRLRDLFATILYHCNPTQPDELWRDFRIHICDDLRYALHTLGFDAPSQDDIFDYGLYLLDKALRPYGCTLADFDPMPLPVHDWDTLCSNPLIIEHTNYDPAHERGLATELESRLNDEQRRVFDDVMDSVRNERGSMFFINGPGGTGKTFIYRAICHAIRAEGWIILCVASSGIAALLLPGGRTSHSMFRIPIDGLNDDSFCNVDKNSRHAELFRRVRAIIWDEAMMQHR